MKNLPKILIIGLILALSFSLAGAEETQEESHKFLSGIEVLTGFGTGKLHAPQPMYQVSPIFIDFDFNLKPLTGKFGKFLPGMFEFVLEPFVGYVSSPRSNAEVGSNFLIKIGFLSEEAKFQPYFKGGLGMLYLSQHTREQGSQFNFNEYGGVGAHYYLWKNTALTVEYRFRHVSNLGIGDPNTGINSNFGICGVSHRF